jgi:hypothetical protein
LLVYYNFNQVSTTVPQFSVAPGTQIGVPLFNSTDPLHTFPSGNLFVNPTAGTTVNQAAGDASGAGGALDARGNTTGGGLPNPAQPYCFVIGPFSTAAFSIVSISFALKSAGTGQFTTLNLLYSTNGSSFTSFATFTTLSQYASYTTLSASLPSGATGQSTLYIEYCFTGASNNNTNNNTFIDNIQINGDVPEPSTYIGGLLGIGVLCWSQRRRLISSLRFRRA